MAPCHHGMCIPTNAGANYTCICEREWDGLNCSDPSMYHIYSIQHDSYIYLHISLDICITEAPCQNNGTCMDGPNEQYNCSCTSTWSGSNCTDPSTLYILYYSAYDLYTYNVKVIFRCLRYGCSMSK